MCSSDLITHQGVGVKRLGGQLVYVLHHDPNYLSRDADLHRNLVHNLIHLLLSNVEPPGWLGERRGGWLDGGPAHYFESDAVDGMVRNSRYLERAQPPRSAPASIPRPLACDGPWFYNRAPERESSSFDGLGGATVHHTAV